MTRGEIRCGQVETAYRWIVERDNRAKHPFRWLGPVPLRDPVVSRAPRLWPILDL